MVYFIENESEMPNEDSDKPILITRWIIETRVYPSGKVVQKVFPTRGATEGYAKKKDVGEQITLKKKVETEDL